MIPIVTDFSRITSCSSPGEFAITKAPTALDLFFAEERKQIKMLLENDPSWQPFRNLSDCFMTYLCAEKLHLALNAETRSVYDQNGHKITGFEHNFHCINDEYHPQYFKPFFLKGFWIPVEEGDLFCSQERLSDHPLIRSFGDKKEILFLVHPKSENLFSPLMEKYASKQITISALSLSSFRTLLIAIPILDFTGKTFIEYLMIKVSLDDSIGGVRRLLFHKECAASVAASALLDNVNTSVAFMKEDLSFVPNKNLLNPECSLALEKGAGMIHRCVPQLFYDQNATKYTIPLFALFGTKNKPLLDTLILQSKKTPSGFVIDSLLRPLAETLVDLIYVQKISLEIHGQNLLLLLDPSAPNGLSIQFLYKDMGGISCLLSNEQKKALPESLQNEKFFYSKNYQEDVGNILEGIANKVCFNLTKQFVKSQDYDQKDTDFALWKAEMIKRGYLENWTLIGHEGDEHQAEHTLQSFCRYGYFEKIFGKLFLEAMSRQGIFLDLCDINPQLTFSFFQEKLFNINDPYNTCNEITWFKDLALLTLQALHG